MPSLTSRLLAPLWMIAIATLLAPTGCESDSPGTIGTQTGNPSCKSTTHCACDWSPAGPLVRGTVTLVEDGQLRVTLDAFVGGDAIDDLTLGEEIGGAFGGPLRPCDDSSFALAVGDEVLVRYQRGDDDRYPGCPEYKSCTESQCGSLDDLDPEDGPGVGAWDQCDGQCIEDTRDACAQRRPEAILNGTLSALPWGEAISFGAWEGTDIALTTDQLSLLTSGDIEACYEALPDALFAPECNDNVAVPVDGTTPTAPQEQPGDAPPSSE